MKVIALGKIAQTKFCNISVGTVCQIINSELRVQPEIYIKIGDKQGASKIYNAVNLETGELADVNTSQRVKIHQDACIVLDPIDRD